MKILITGGAGFVCSHLAEKLYKKGHSLILLDNLLTGNIKNIEQLISNDNVDFLEHDVQNHIEISDDVEFIFHFASAASPIAYQENPVNTLKAGSIGTINTLGLAKVKKADTKVNFFENFSKIIFLLKGKISRKPITSVANPGIINNKAAKAIAAPDKTSYAGVSFLLN